MLTKVLLGVKPSPHGCNETITQFMITSALLYTHVHRHDVTTSVQKHFPIHKLEAKESLTSKVTFISIIEAKRS